MRILLAILLLIALLAILLYQQRPAPSLWMTLLEVALLVIYGMSAYILGMHHNR